MFSGIVEDVGVVEKLEKEGTNLILTVSSRISEDCYIDQSISHNGVCLTVTAIDGKSHTVAAIQETLDKSNIGSLKVGDIINLEKSMTIEKMLDGHLVQGHVDATAECIEVKELDGSWYYKFSYPPIYSNLIVDKGSVAVNGVSLTVVAPDDKSFQVAIIPYTYQHTNFKNLAVGQMVNLEFDIIGKYVARHLSLQGK